MNRYSAPWRVLPPTFLVGYLISHGSVLVYLILSATGRNAVAEDEGWLFLSIAGVVCIMLAMLSHAIVRSVYGNAHLHTSTVREIWTERRMYEDADFKTLMASDDAHTIYLMKLASSSRDIYTIEDANTESLIRPGSLVTVRRRMSAARLLDNHSWRATTVAVTPPEQVVAPLPTE